MVEVQITKGLEGNEAAAVIRQKVFVEEQGFLEEFDTIDKEAIHVVLFSDKKAAATGRTFTQDGETAYHIGRVAVLKEYRGQNFGKRIMQELEKAAKEHGARQVALSAQVRAKDFYRKLGYQECGEVYLDENYPHIKMIKTL